MRKRDVVQPIATLTRCGPCAGGGPYSWEREGDAMPLAMVPIVVPVSSTLSACGVTLAGFRKVRHLIRCPKGLTRQGSGEQI